uniref:Uncharacterized protein n=2 Tax=Oryza TaxID=4527 RepID=Q6Z4U0_ORYSJ|nr:hypothetical protein [Oryza sativa Japonica Group]BAD05549.1 hypothetical protein [Oryza sativa Japonica Group]
MAWMWLTVLTKNERIGAGETEEATTGEASSRHGARCRWSGALRGYGPMRRPHIPCVTAAVAGEAITPSRCVVPKVVPLARSGKPKVGSIELNGVAAAA